MTKLNPASRPKGRGFLNDALTAPLLPRHKWQGITRCGVNSSREYFIKKRKQALTKIDSFREDFRKKEMKADLEETRRMWRGLSERFKWWGSLP